MPDPRDPDGHIMRQFDKLDANKDGWLSSDELFHGLLSAGWEQDEVSQLFDELDADGNGKITREEFLSYNWSRAARGRLPYPKANDKEYDAFLLRELALWCQTRHGHPNWIDTRGEDDQHRKEAHAWIYRASLSWFTSWKRGTGPGELLEKPEIDDVPVARRGIAKEWCDALKMWTCDKNMWWEVRTRCLVEAFIKPITQDEKCPLYFFIPKKFRAPPDTFISHSWDLAAHTWVKACAEQGGRSMWLDIFNVNQWDSSSDVAHIAETVKGACPLAPPPSPYALSHALIPGPIDKGSTTRWSSFAAKGPQVPGRRTPCHFSHGLSPEWSSSSPISCSVRQRQHLPPDSLRD